MCALAGVSARSGPSRRSSQRSRCGVNAGVLSTRARSTARRIGTERNALLLLAARHRLGDPRHPGLELVAVGEKGAALVVEAARHGQHGLSERVAPGIGRLDGEPRLCRAEGQLLPVPRDAGGEQRVLQRVLPLGKLGGDDPLLAREAQPGDRLALGPVGAGLRFPEHCELVAREQVGVARDDRRLLGRLLLPHAHGPRLLGALLEVRVEPLLEGVDRGIHLVLIQHKLLTRPAPLHGGAARATCPARAARGTRRAPATRGSR